MKRSHLPLALPLLLWACVAAADTAAPARMRRLALLVGTNDGGEGRLRLRYAVSDAQSLARVLDELGGVAPGDSTLLLEAGREDFEKGLKALRTRLAAVPAGVRTEVLVYYSGHADEEGLLLRGERLPYRELRRALETLPADVRIAIVDSCASGAFARTKGGARRPAFLVDTSSTVRGHAILTSSSEDEVSQESDRIGGSFFTHHLVSGLRGAADLSRDGRVTLNEAYHFAFNETLSRTERTRAGPQHPAYDIELAGSGDLVMTDLRATSAGLMLASTVEGRLSIRDAQGALVVELAKPPGRPTELGLAPGRYSVIREDEGQRARAEVTLADGRRTTLTLEAFSPFSGEAVAVRGGTAVAPLVVGRPDPDWRWLNLGVFPGIDTNGILAAPVENSFSLSLLAGRSARLRGVALALGANWTDAETRGLQMTLGTNVSGGDVNGWQASLAGNAIAGRLDGLQSTLGVNYARDRVQGVQLAIAANIAGADVTHGLQGGVGFNFARGDVAAGQLSVGANVTGGRLSGLQLSGGGNVVGADAVGIQTAAGFNWTHGPLTGAQVSAGLNVVGQPLHGLQVGGGANWAHATVSGVQVAGGVNHAPQLAGVQLALLNVGGEVSGAQVGVVNIARKVTGTQVGLLNLADELYGAPVGLLSLARNGQLHVEAFGSDIHAANVAVKLGTKYVYTVGRVGSDAPMTERAGFSYGLGLGVHLPFEPFFVDFEASVGSHHRYDDVPSELFLQQARLVVGWQLAPRFALIAGPTYNVLASFGERPLEELSFVRAQGTHTLRWPGFTVGLRI